MPMKRIIINYDESLHELKVVELVWRVMGDGRISGSGKQFCYATTFESGPAVYASLTRKGNDVFYVTSNTQISE